MRPEIIHARPPSTKRTFKSLPPGGFFSLTGGGLFSKVNDTHAFTWEVPPLHPGLSDMIYVGESEPVFIVKAQIEVQP